MELPPPVMDPPPPVVDLHPVLTPEQLGTIQGDIWTKGFPKYHETYYFFSIKTGKASLFSQRLKVLATQTPPLISSLKKARDDHNFISMEREKYITAEKLKGIPKKEIHPPTVPIANALIAFTSKGLKAIQDDSPSKNLGLLDIEDTDPAFVAGMSSDKVRTTLNDPATKKWDVLFQSTKIHGLLKIAGSSPEMVKERLMRIQVTLKHGEAIEDAAPTDSQVVGWTRPNDRGKEHFGFEDGISQPRMNGIDSPDPAPEPNMNTAQELLIVTDKTASENQDVRRPAWMQNGSFLVFRKLEQDVAAFECLTKKYWAATKCESQEQMGAKLMGRWQSGAPIATFETKDTADPGKAKVMNNFVYGAESPCPVSAHIRKTNIREKLDGNEPDQRCRRTRMIRNGIPYGLDYKGHENDGSTRGLLFACYQGHIEDSFQHMQASWSNEPTFRNADFGHDPIIGQVPDSSEGKPGKLKTSFLGSDKSLQTVEFAPLVTLKGGEYFFVPPISALSTPLGSDAPATGPSTRTA
ncbi:hypothetical protein EPUS_05967 [Endocarpon pusillum Z07020]|uniref:Dyp-type peroxidase n=1 Tax=Endocarpon pusillum (strain Z07020 / HMAS-L-300199) TaxID=1263415 RepID=U1FX29_ENDPU|nr:uncharacterized protein EPUS_05967 [Endocarpon pusillum Z07020]ERF69422.1 hypothetical protein EPUS_05967 [Endocarpon pusillum Z07020]